ncbi:MAG TPA: phosphotransferase [Chloroflexota bacterium]|nr:phosphotransferase [Chloroflexota bacterium]
MPRDDVDPRPLLNALGVPAVSALERVSGGEDTLLWRVDTPEASYALRVMRPDQAVVARREAAAMRAAAAAGIAVPRVEAETFWHERPAMLLSWCPGRTVMAEVRARPWRVWALARALGEAQARLNRAAAPAELLERGERWLDWAGPGETALAARLRALPRRADRLLHLDYHPLNTMTDGRAITAVLDWTNAGAGDPRADAARTLSILLLSPAPPGTPGVFALFRRVMAAAWSRGYRAVAGEPAEMPLFHAWAGAAMVRDWAHRVEDPGHWVTDEQLVPARRWSAHWKRAARV